MLANMILFNDLNNTNSTNQSNSNPWTNDSLLDPSPCTYDFGEDLQTRFLLVAVVMTAVCCVGVMGNVCVVVVLSRKRMRCSSSWYLIALALFDSGVMLATIALYCVEVMYDYTRNVYLYLAWHHYVRFGYFLSHMFQVLTVYLTLAATIERCISLWTPSIANALCLRQRTFAWITAIVICTISLTITKLWELEVHFNGECSGFGRYELAPAPLLSNDDYRTIYGLWVSNLCFVFVPFVSLALLNFLIWLKMRWSAGAVSNEVVETVGMAETSRAFQRKLKRRNREATIVLFVVVLVFLICNAPGVALTLAEHIDQAFLENQPQFYSFARDGINFLTVINSATNFLIYMIFGREFRKELMRPLRGRNHLLELINLVKIPIDANEFRRRFSVSPRLRTSNQMTASSSTEAETELNCELVMTSSNIPNYGSSEHQEDYALMNGFCDSGSRRSTYHVQELIGANGFMRSQSLCYYLDTNASVRF